MAYLDALAEIASQGPSPEDLETIKRLARVAGSTSYSGAAAPDRSSAEQPVDTTVDPRFTQREIAPVQQSDVSKRLAAIGQQQADIQRTPAHGLRRTLGNVAGVGAGVLSRNPAIGVDVSERVKDPNYYRQYGDLERQAAALRPVQTAEEKRTKGCCHC